MEKVYASYDFFFKLKCYDLLKLSNCASKMCLKVIMEDIDITAMLLTELQMDVEDAIRARSTLSFATV